MAISLLLAGHAMQSPRYVACCITSQKTPHTHDLEKQKVWQSPHHFCMPGFGTHADKLCDFGEHDVWGPEPCFDTE